MSIREQEAYINTAASGNVIQIEHNLNGTPGVSLTELVSGKEVYVSLMDARVAEIKAIDDNVVQLTFSAAFQGYIRLAVIEADNPSDHDRLLELESKYPEQMTLIESKTSKDQWIQMNNLLAAQIEYLENKTEDLQSQINMLKAEVDAF